MNKSINLPFSARITLGFINLFAIVFSLYIAQGILIPIIMATIFAVLLNPIVNYLVSKKTNRLVAISLTVFVGLLIVLGLLFFLISQATSFSEALPMLKTKFNKSSVDLIAWIAEKTNIKEVKIQSWVEETQAAQIKEFKIGDNISRFGNVMATVVLFPVYLVMILYYKPLFLEFFKRLFLDRYFSAVEEVLLNTKKIIQSYVVGLFIEFIIISLLNSLGLLLMGIRYAFLLGVIGALLNLIPYLGAMIAASIYMTIAFITMPPIYVLYVLIMYAVIQVVDNNFLIPRIVASRVQINALASIISVIVGGTIWGIPGMFLSIPLIAIVKVICDHVDSLNAWGYLIGNQVSSKK
jgi:predicted PurR-regulated permease PerM